MGYADFSSRYAARSGAAIRAARAPDTREIYGEGPLDTHGAHGTSDLGEGAGLAA
jgi:hypothetical protein